MRNVFFRHKRKRHPTGHLVQTEINEIKLYELQMRQKPKPITFTIETDPTKELKAGARETVKFEIEGAGDIVTSFVRK